MIWMSLDFSILGVSQNLLYLIGGTECVDCSIRKSGMVESLVWASAATTLGDRRDLVTIDLFGDDRRDLARRGRGVSRYFDGHNSV
jgi:hypothetical protein